MQREPSREFWSQQRVWLSGHTGFKGAWLAEWLLMMGAEVHGFSLPCESNRDVFEALGHRERIQRHVEGDIRDRSAVRAALIEARPTVVLHLAAQALVRRSYREPVETFATNVMGTAHVLDAARALEGLRSVVVVTTDKVYANREWRWGYRENDALGGRDPYSASKACAELVTSAYSSSYFAGGPMIATARAGNVIGGGDWAEERLIPDCIRAFESGAPIEVRSPGAVRPWQHAVEPLRGYLLLAELGARGEVASDAWNFGPQVDACRPVRQVVDLTLQSWGAGASWIDRSDRSAGMHEANLLRLDATRAAELGWTPRLTLPEAIAMSVRWYRAQLGGAGRDELISLTRAQIVG